MSDLLFTDEVSKEYRVPESTLVDWRFRKIGPPWAKIGRRVMYTRAGCEKWFSEQFKASEQKRAS